ncbi:uncharacterized protein LOC127846492 [Dreissena polymorpha]|uniref:Uncharacterized protein n=1 Tax=Dreissena polymorpha TaxID=45954 RepID=A0A9D4IF82_DREPO|nr:uncharacterized protein LOC127846492 [Dreissena polymorpha]KAH3773196.1 hypothetical protein DPMN_174553 [Dreissena polymorpha]
MPSWRFLCCTFNKATDDGGGIDAPNDMPSWRKNKSPTKSRSKHASGKKTWTRRSLLENEENELEMIPRHMVPYQMRALETPTSIPMMLDDEDDEIRKRLVRQIATRSRTSHQHLFQKQISEPTGTKTTFPWMDEGFVPNARPGTRLGISSVQMNARRSSQGNLLGNADSLNFRDSQPTSAFQPYSKSKSFTEGQSSPIVTSYRNGFAPMVVKPSYVPNKQVRTIPDGHVAKNNVLENDNHMKVYRAPTSDVGVRSIVSSTGPTRGLNKIPKLEDDPSAESELLAAPSINNDPQMTNNPRRTVMDMFENEMELSEESADDDDANKHRLDDISFAGDMSFGSNKLMFDTDSPEIHKQSTGMFSNNSKYDVLKSHSTKIIEKGRKPAINKKSESMYGYIPRAVTNLHASNVLEGTKLDDFFMRRQAERQQHIAPMSNNHSNYAILKNESVTDAEEDQPVIITTLVEDEENDEVEVLADVQNVDSIAYDMQCSSNARSVETVIDDMIRQLNAKKTNNKSGNDNGGHFRPPPHNEPSKRDGSEGFMQKLKHLIHRDPPKRTDENENQVIMIDFPPNVAADFNANANDETNSKTSQLATDVDNSEVLY